MDGRFRAVTNRCTLNICIISQLVDPVRFVRHMLSKVRRGRWSDLVTFSTIAQRPNPKINCLIDSNTCFFTIYVYIGKAIAKINDHR